MTAILGLVVQGLFRGVVGVPEPSARDGDVFNLVAADHIGICRPVTKTTRSFYGLTDLIDIVLDDLTVMAQRFLLFSDIFIGKLVPMPFSSSHTLPQFDQPGVSLNFREEKE